jgi:DNA polymerase-4
VGIAPVKFISKIASSMNKPDGVTEVPPGGELAFLHPLPIGRLWGVGPKAQERLARHGIRTIGDLAQLGEETLASWFGEHGRHMSRLSRGIDERAVEPGRERKSISHEDTYAVDVVGVEALERKLLSQATRVADRLVAKGIKGRRVQLKIRDGTFVTETRQCMLPEPTNEAKRFYQAACKLLGSIELKGRAFRLTGVGVSALVTDEEAGAKQLDLLDPSANEPPKSAQLQEVLSAVRERYGHQALYPADASSSDRPGSAGGFTKTLEDD